jgi:hypothetical protein
VNTPSDNILPGTRFKITNDNNYDIDNKRITNVADPEDH